MHISPSTQNSYISPSTDFFTSFYSSPLSPHSTTSSHSSDSCFPEPKITKKRGRKCSNIEPITKRAQQNRVAQRSFRDRKRKNVEDLEEKVRILEEAQRQCIDSVKLVDENRELKMRIKELEMENENLKIASLIPGTTSSSLPLTFSNVSPIITSASPPLCFPGSSIPITQTLYSDINISPVVMPSEKDMAMFQNETPLFEFDLYTSPSPSMISDSFNFDLFDF